MLHYQSRLRGPSREASFDEDRGEPVTRSSVKNRSTTYISTATPPTNNNSRDAKKSVPPSPAPKKKVIVIH